MNYNKKTIMDVDVAGKKILLRCDFNVPQDKETHAITSDKRIVASLPTIRYLLERGAAVIACSHLGKPKGQWKDSLTLRPVAEHLSQLLGQEVIFAQDIVGEDAKAKAAALQGGQIMLLENLRFDPREEKNDPEFARELASMAELYVSDAFGTVGTGGFGIRADSIASYSPYIQGVITVFMILCGINFNLYYLLLLRQWRAALRSDELWTYLGLAVVATGVITLDLRGVYGGLGTCLRQAAFQVSSVLTTTGYATADFDLWPGLSRAILFALLFIGGCAGSTAGGLKVSRAMILLRTIRREVNRLVHPRRVTAVRCDGKALSSEVQRGVSIYFALYCLCILITFLCLSGEPFSLETNLSAVVSCFNNVGPGLGAVGPAGSYAGYSVLSKLLLSAAMLMGRLEIYPMLVALSPSVWRKD